MSAPINLFLVLSFLVIIQVKMYSDNLEGRIVGGKPASDGDVPYTVSLRRSWNNEHFCGGSLITNRHVLTAAHCVYYSWGGPLPAFTIYVVAGQKKLETNGSSIYREASKIVAHPQYSTKNLVNDVAIIEITSPFPLTSLIATVTLKREPINSGTCQVSGWGYQKFGSDSLSPILMLADVKIVDFATCYVNYYARSNGSIVLDRGMICAGHQQGKTDACGGDSGGPLTCNGLLSGVVSAGVGCANPDFPGIYANVPYYYDWILSKVNTCVDCSTSKSISEAVSVTESSKFFFVTEGTINGFPFNITNGEMARYVAGFNCFSFLLSFIILTVLN